MLGAASSSAHVLPDLLKPGLKIVFCGTAAGNVSAARGAYYAHPQNRFWSALHAFGLTPRKLRPEDYAELPQWGLGLTDIAKHVSGMDRELPPGALGREACAALEAKITSRSRSGSRSRASPPGAAISAAPPASASSPSASAEPACGSCLRHRRPRAGIGIATRTGGGCSQTRLGRQSPPLSRPEPRRPGARPRVRRDRQTKASKTKLIQGNPRKKAWISLDSFGRIGTFQWVTANPNKKTFPASCSPGNASERPCLLCFRRSDASPAPLIRSAENIAHNQVFRKQMWRRDSR